MTKKKKDPRGGPGRNQGRKKGVTFTEPTVVMRVPLVLCPEIEKMISEHKKIATQKFNDDLKI
jgi:hypothetical protein